MLLESEYTRVALGLITFCDIYLLFFYHLFLLHERNTICVKDYILKVIIYKTHLYKPLDW
jgi:hypothetical protein